MSETKERDISEVIADIERTVNMIRPYIQADGGDVQLVDFQDGIVTVKMLGACAGCFMIDSTLTDGIQAILMDEVPEVKGVTMDTEYLMTPDYF